MESKQSTVDAVFAERLTAWQRVHGRHDLPWQRTNRPYERWVSEIMLQQTQVATVIPYFERFMERFPTVGELARADEDEVLRYWAGLGYYSRGRNLRRAALEVLERFGGVMPERFDDLVSLPGIGESTAAAVSAFACGERRAMTDGNAKRVVARVYAIEGAVGSSAFERAVKAKCLEILPAEADMADYTQGLMDLGAIVCRRRKPACEACPLADLCAARAAGRAESFPEPKKAVPKACRRVAMAFVQTDEGLWLARRTGNEGTETGSVWKGLWTPPMAVDAEASHAELWARFEGDYALSAPLAGAELRHLLSHRELLIEARLYRATPETTNRLRAAGFTPHVEGEAMPGRPAPVVRLLEALMRPSLFGER